MSYAEELRARYRKAHQALWAPKPAIVKAIPLPAPNLPDQPASIGEEKRDSPRDRYDFSFTPMSDDQLIEAIGPMSLQAVIAIGAAFYKRSAEELLASRKYDRCQERLNIFWIARRLRPDLSWPRLGRAFGRDHSSMMHSQKLIDQRGGPPDPAHCSCILAALWRWNENQKAAVRISALLPEAVQP